MKIIVIGDIHGRDYWRNIIQQNPDYDLVIFIGDYLDSFKYNTEHQINNFHEILVFKKSNPDKVVLLLGNHDYHYLKFIKNKYSGYNYATDIRVNETLYENIMNKNILIAYSYDKYLFTHAGVSLQYLKSLEMFEESMLNDGKEICNLLNDYLIFKPQILDFTMGKNFDEYGDDTSQTPLWIRPKSLKQSCVKDFIHIVGHTRNNDIIIDDNIVLIDSLPNYLIIENNEFKICRYQK